MQIEANALGASGGIVHRINDRGIPERPLDGELLVDDDVLRVGARADLNLVARGGRGNSRLNRGEIAAAARIHDEHGQHFTGFEGLHAQTATIRSVFLHRGRLRDATSSGDRLVRAADFAAPRSKCSVYYSWDRNPSRKVRLAGDMIGAMRCLVTGIFPAHFGPFMGRPNPHDLAKKARIIATTRPCLCEWAVSLTGHHP